MEDTTADEQTVETAPEVNTPEASQEPTAADLLAAKDAELARLAEERDNYRRAALKAKGKYREEEPEEEGEDTLESIIDRKVEEKLFDRRAQQLQQEKQLLLEQTLKENAEMRNALRNRPGAPTSAGSNLDKAPGKTESYWSPAQEAELKSKGLDPKVVWENLQKSSGTMGAPKA